MLVRLILFLIVGFAVYAGVRWWRARKLLGSGGLNVIELNEMMKLAKKAPRLDAALKMRVLIVDTAAPDARRRVAERVDDVLRRLANQEQIQRQIRTALEGIDTKRLAAKIDDARVEAETATDPERRDKERERLRGLETQAEQAERLAGRQRDLDASAERILVELKNLHLAMLDANSSAAGLESEPVKHALSELEDTSERLRQEASAEDEVNRLLRAAAQRARQ